MGSRIIGCGGYLPEKILTNRDLEKFLDTDDEWIVSRTGISKRHIAAEDESTSMLAEKAAKAAIEDAKISAEEIDLLIVCTTTPDNSMPATANKLHGYLGLKNIPSFDLQAVCSGFIYGMHVADAMMGTGSYKTVLLVCAEKMSALLDWSDRKSCILFGDGAGAVVLRRDSSDLGIIDSKIYSDGSAFDILHTDGGIGTNCTTGKLRMLGGEVFKKAVEKMYESVNEILLLNELTVEDIDYFIPHQANIRIIDNLAGKFKLDKNKVIVTIDRHANCSAASIPLALAELRSKCIIEPGKIVLFTAFGAGVTWGSLLLKW